MAQNVGPARVTLGYRIRKGNVAVLVVMPYRTGDTAIGSLRVVYDNGDEDDLFPDPGRTTTAGTTFAAPTVPARLDGWIVSGSFGLANIGGAALSVRGYGQIVVASDANLSKTLAVIGDGFVGAFQLITVGEFENDDFQ